MQILHNILSNRLDASASHSDHYIEKLMPVGEKRGPILVYLPYVCSCQVLSENRHNGNIYLFEIVTYYQGGGDSSVIRVPDS